MTQLINDSMFMDWISDSTIAYTWGLRRRWSDLISYECHDSSAFTHMSRQTGTSMRSHSSVTTGSCTAASLALHILKSTEGVR